MPTGWRRALCGSALAVAAVAMSACATSTSGRGDAASQGGSSTPSGSTSPDFPTSSPPTSPSPSPSSSSTSAAPTLADRSTALDAHAGGTHVIVRVPDGYEAATYDQAGHIAFWHDPQASTDWTQVGSSQYPVVAQLGPPHATAGGALLRGMQHATFIVRGTFTGDSSGNAVAFTTGPHGWGVIKAESNGNIGPSGHPVGSDQIGLGFDFGTVRGLLRTEDCPQDRAIAQCGAHPVVKLWRWAGRDFHRAS